MTATTTTDVYYSTMADDPLLGEIVKLYVDEMPERIAALTARWRAADWEGLVTLAHQMKGAAGSHGFAQLTPLAARLEAVAAQPAASGEIIDAAVGALIEACRRAR